MLMLQDYLCRRADKHMIPKVDNTNVDRSVATIHATVLACLRHTSQVKLRLCPFTFVLSQMFLLIFFFCHSCCSFYPLQWWMPPC